VHPLAQDFAAHCPSLDVNDHLRLASTFSGLALIMKQLSPVPGSGKMVELECDSFVLQSFDTATGLKFFLTADPDSRHIDAVLKEVYVLYSDYVLKNPFYELDMPIQCSKFDEKVQKLAADYNRR
jgi:trafficking protein particle complex subunit 4